MNAFMCRRTSKAMRLATVILLLIALLSNSMIFAYAAEEDSFSFTIGETTFTVTPGNETPVTTSSGDGSVEIATASAAVIWANLGGAGDGVLSDGSITGVTEGVTYVRDGNNVTFTTASGGQYKVTVRDNSANGTPVADGSTKTYDFTDGSVVSMLYNTANSFTSITSTDRLLTLTGNHGSYWHDSQHGIIIAAGDTISVNVAGNATVELTLCSFSASTGEFSVAAQDTEALQALTPTTFSAAAGNDADIQTVNYSGGSNVLTFSYSGATCYLHGISVTNEAEPTQVTDQDEMPETSGSNITATATGQRLTLSQTGGSLNTSGASNPDQVGYYGFEATEDLNRLEADITVTSCGSTSANGVFFGIFDTKINRIAVAGIRNSTNLRCVYSNPNNSYYLGAGGFNGTIAEGQTVHIVAQKTSDDDLAITLTTDSGETYTATLSYMNSDSCQLGFVVANATATITNMVYSDADGNKLYDQNDCYKPIGQPPVVTSVTATALGTREAIQLGWTISTAASGDGFYRIEIKHDTADWEPGGTTTDLSYTYPISEGGDYQFRVSGGLGSNGAGTAAVESNIVEVIRALTTPVVAATATDSAVTLSWEAVTGATRYEIYRYYDNGAAELIATITETTYTDTNVTAETPYYYYVIARTADNSNWSNPSATVWVLPTAGHTGAYLPAAQDAQFTLTSGTDETVSSPALTIAGTVDRAGIVRAYLNGAQLGADQTVAAGGAFSYDATLAEGSNTLTLILTDETGAWSRTVYTYRYLPTTSIDMIVNADYEGEDGALVDGIPTYSTVQAAVDTVSSDNTEETVIFVRNGDYEEHLMVDAPNITLIGESEAGTRIHCYPADFHPEDATYEAGGDMTKRCATYIQSTATNFHAENISFANDYDYGALDGKTNKSADALRCDANGASFVNVTFSGVQDTLYMDAGVQTYTNCRIEGAIDFIYSGNAAKALFNDCEIVYVNAGRTSGVICAPRTAADADCGLVFYRCSIIAEEGCPTGSLSLARPWGANAAVYWIDCYMSDAVNTTVDPEDGTGTYQNMSGNLYQNARFYECGSYGPGATINQYRRQISPAQVQELLNIFSVTDTDPLPGADLGEEPTVPPTGGGEDPTVPPTEGGEESGGETTPPGEDTGDGETTTPDDDTTDEQPTDEDGSSPSSSSNHRPDASVNGEGGTVYASSNGTVTITPDEGYEIASITVNGEQVAIPENGRLTGLDRRDEVIVTFERIETEEETEPDTTQQPFTDVAENAWYADAVQYMLGNGMMNGTTATTFSPDETTTRAMIVTILHRLESEPTAAASNFTDVAAGSYYADAVNWAAANGIVNGVSETNFAPDDAITREQMAAILYRYAQFKGYDTAVGGMSLSEYADASQISAYATTAMQWANAEGLITGVTDTTLSPQGSATRAQVATILMRFVENIAK